MKKYQQPEMEVIEFEVIDTITDSNLYTPEDELNAGGNEGKLDWDEL